MDDMNIVAKNNRITNIHFSIALEKETNRLVNAKDVPNGLNCNCYCAKCKEDLVAANREVKQRAHFRHNKASNCPFSQNYETYIHWLAKEIIKRIDLIKLPPIKYEDLKLSREQQFSMMNKFNILLKEIGLVNEVRGELSNFHGVIFQTSTEVKIDSFNIEKFYRTAKGNIEVDAVLTMDNHELFIEPFYTHPIDDIKYEKLLAIDVSTISINLIPFVRNSDYDFTIAEFTDYIKNNLSEKKWVIVRKAKKSKLINSLFNRDFAINKSKLYEDILKNKATNENLDKLYKEKQELDLEYHKNSKKLNEDIEKLSLERNDIQLRNYLINNDKANS